MAYLLLRIVFTVAFSHLLRFSQARTPRPMAAAAVNYLLAGVGCALWAWLGGVRLHPTTMALGVVAGITYATSLVMMLPTMRRSGVSVTGAVVQLSLMVPVGVAVWRFGEFPNGYQTAGIALTLVALPLLSAARAVEGEPKRGLSPLVLLLFLSNGVSQSVMKEFTVARPGTELPLYSAALFLAATVVTYGWMAFSGDTGRAGTSEAATTTPPTAWMGEWPFGALLGVVNGLQLVFLLLALRALPAVVVFPVSAALGILVNVAASMLFWGERPPPAGWAGMGMAVVAVILLNLK